MSQILDGASVMSGEVNGLQKKTKSIAPQTLFTHCKTHTLDNNYHKIPTNKKTALLILI